MNEGLIAPEQLPVARSTAQDPAQDIAAAGIRRQHAVPDQEGERPGVVGDDAQRDVGLRMRARHDVRELGGAVDQGGEAIRFPARADALEHGGPALETAARIDRGLRQGRHRPRRILVELHEDQVPDLHETTGIARRIVVRAARDLTPVVMDLGARTAGARIAHRPEVLVLVEPVDLRGRDADLVAPDGVGLVVVAEDRDHEVVRLEADALGQQRPGVFDRRLLEIVAEGEVAEHLEEGVVARGAADVLEIVVLAGDPHAFLRRRGPDEVPRLLAEKEPLEGHHARVDEHQRRVGIRDERGARDAPVAPLLEEAEKSLANLPGRERHGIPRVRWSAEYSGDRPGNAVRALRPHPVRGRGEIGQSDGARISQRGADPGAGGIASDRWARQSNTSQPAHGDRRPIPAHPTRTDRGRAGQRLPAGPRRASRPLEAIDVEVVPVHHSAVVIDVGLRLGGAALSPVNSFHSESEVEAMPRKRSAKSSGFETCLRASS